MPATLGQFNVGASYSVRAGGPPRDIGFDGEYFDGWVPLNKETNSDIPLTELVIQESIYPPHLPGHIGHLVETIVFYDDEMSVSSETHKLHNFMLADNNGNIPRGPYIAGTGLLYNDPVPKAFYISSGATQLDMTVGDRLIETTPDGWSVDMQLYTQLYHGWAGFPKDGGFPLVLGLNGTLDVKHNTVPDPSGAVNNINTKKFILSLKFTYENEAGRIGIPAYIADMFADGDDDGSELSGTLEYEFGNVGSFISVNTSWMDRLSIATGVSYTGHNQDIVDNAIESGNLNLTSSWFVHPDNVVDGAALIFEFNYMNNEIPEKPKGKSGAYDYHMLSGFAPQGNATCSKNLRSDSTVDWLRSTLVGFTHYVRWEVLEVGKKGWKIGSIG